MNQTLQKIKKMPKFAPPTKQLRLSEITPTIKQEAEEEQPEEESGGWLSSMRRRWRRRFGG